MTSRRTTAWLGAACLVFGAAVAFGAVSPVPPDADGANPGAKPVGLRTNDASSRPTEPVLSGNPLWAISLKDLSATRERPLFSPSRRPPSPPAASAVQTLAAVPIPVEPERPQLTLVGTIAGDGESFGIFIDQSGSRVVRLKIGQSHNGWLLRRVDRRETMLEKNAESVVLTLPTAAVQPDRDRASR